MLHASAKMAFIIFNESTPHYSGAFDHTLLSLLLQIHPSFLLLPQCGHNCQLILFSWIQYHFFINTSFDTADKIYLYNWGSQDSVNFFFHEIWQLSVNWSGDIDAFVSYHFRSSIIYSVFKVCYTQFIVLIIYVTRQTLKQIYSLKGQYTPFSNCVNVYQTLKYMAHRKNIKPDLWRNS